MMVLTTKARKTDRNSHLSYDLENTMNFQVILWH